LKRDTLIANVEFTETKGKDRLFKLLKTKAILAHSIGLDEMALLTPLQITSRFIRAVKERNMRILYFHILPGKSFEENVNLIKDVKAKLEDNGFRILKSSPIRQFESSRILLVLAELGAIIGLMILVLQILSPFDKGGLKGDLKVLIFLIPVLIVLYFVGHLSLIRKSVALLAAIVFPCLAVISINDNTVKHLKISVILRKFLKICSITLIGSLLISGILSSSDFMMKLSQFSGVKFALLIPILLVGINLFVKNKGSLNAILDTKVSIKHLLYLSIAVISLASVVIVFIGRSGNFVLPVPAFEEKIRMVLENTLIARPRTKELIGHLFMILGITLMIRYNIGSFKYESGKLINLVSFMFFIVLGVLGQVSMINTFCHIHTPFLLSVLRIFNGLWIGTTIGLFFAFVLLKIIRRQNVNT
ncbi:MAG: DUF5693 family protein, partial [Candidatus Firestonebacteria bacterium]